MKLAIYFTHHDSLGHTTRVVSILDALKKHFGDKIEILILHNGKEQEFIHLENYGKVVNLPFPIGKSYFYPKDMERKIAQMDGKMKTILKERVRIMKNSVSEFKPDIFITEFFPMGKELWYPEIPVILKFVKENFGSKIIASTGYPSFDKKTYEMIDKYYDHILFHCTENDVNNFIELLKNKGQSTEKFESIINDFSDKIRFTGYITNEKKSVKNEALDIHGDSKLVLVSRGGGVIFPRIITAALKAANIMKNDGVYFLISTGPTTPDKEFSMYERVGKNLANVTLVEYLPNLLYYLNIADLSVNMAGYNTGVELMQLQKQNICIPANQLEQLYRAAMMKGMNISRIIDYNNLTGETLSSKIKEMLDSPLKPKKPINTDSFKGIENTLKIIGEIGV